MPSTNSLCIVSLPFCDAIICLGPQFLVSRLGPEAGDAASPHLGGGPGVAPVAAYGVAPTLPGLKELFHNCHGPFQEFKGTSKGEEPETSRESWGRNPSFP